MGAHHPATYFPACRLLEAPIYPDIVVHAERAVPDACVDLTDEIARSESVDDLLGLHLRIKILTAQLDHCVIAALDRVDTILKARD